MSKRKHLQAWSGQQSGSHQNTPTPVGDEMKHVRRDLWQTIIVNLVFLVILIGLYYWNKSGQPLDNWINNYIKL